MVAPNRSSPSGPERAQKSQAQETPPVTVAAAPGVTAQQPHQLVRRTVALVLAGGRGSRLKQLTDKRAKPAVYFGGKFRIVDFALSNCVNSGIAPHRRRHAVQEPLAAAPPAARLELPARRDERDGRPAARAAARRRGALVPRHGRRGLPEPGHHPGLAPRVHRHAGGRPRLQDGLLADAEGPRRQRRRLHGGLHRGAARRGDARSA